MVPTRFDDLPDITLLRVAQVASLVGVSVPTIWRRVSAGQFPSPIRIPPRQTAWRVGDLRAYVTNPPLTKPFNRPASPGRRRSVPRAG